MLYVAWHPAYHHPLPEGHRFPMEKYSLLHQMLLHEGTLQPENYFTPTPITETEILLCHSQTYWEKLRDLRLSYHEIRRTGFPLSEALVEREKLLTGGSLQAARLALEHGIGMNIAGGTHHAGIHHGEGFCLLNDLAIAAATLLHEGKIRKAVIVDLDVHQGNGTAQIFADVSEIFTFSMHGAQNYPLQKEQSSLDIPLPDGTSDAQYLEILQTHLPAILQQENPDLVLYQCGVDVLESDKLGRLNLSLQGCKQRDAIVFESCLNRNVPVVAAMGGGYSPNIRDILEAHANTFRLAAQLVH